MRNEDSDFDHCSIEMIVTDRGVTVSESLPFCMLTAANFGAAAFGDSKVFTLSTAAPVNVSALADFAVDGDIWLAADLMDEVHELVGAEGIVSITSPHAEFTVAGRLSRGPIPLCQ